MREDYLIAHHNIPLVPREVVLRFNRFVPSDEIEALCRMHITEEFVVSRWSTTTGPGKAQTEIVCMIPLRANFSDVTCMDNEMILLPETNVSVLVDGPTDEFEFHLEPDKEFFDTPTNHVNCIGVWHSVPPGETEVAYWSEYEGVITKYKLDQNDNLCPVGVDPCKTVEIAPLSQWLLELVNLTAHRQAGFDPDAAWEATKAASGE